jgi:Right handed beta helix region
MKHGLLLFLVLTCGAGMAFGFGTTYVSVHGADTPFCGINGSPCFSLQAAYINTDTGGLIKIMDANAYAPGGIVINRPVTIDGSGMGVLENIFAPTAPVIQILANCTLRGLIIQVTSGDGIQIGASGVQVHLENVTIQGDAGTFINGVHIISPNVDLTADHVTVNGAPTGFNLASTNATFSGSNLHVVNSTGIGFSMKGGSGTIRDSVIHGTGASSASTGVYLTAASLLVERSEISSNGVGLESNSSGGPATLRISDCVIANNATGLVPIGAGQIISFRTNTFGGNGSDGTPPLGTSLK